MALNPADGYPHTPEHYAEFASNQERQAFQFVKDIDTAMRANYAVNIATNSFWVNVITCHILAGTNMEALCG